MALCESQLDSALPALKREEQSPSSENQSPEKKPRMDSNGDIYGLDQVPGGLPLSVDYRSPVSHFVPPAVEMYASRQKSGPITTPDTSDGSSTTPKRKRGRPRVDKTSPEYLANLAARQQAKEMAAMMNNSTASTPDSGEKRKRGRPRVDKTSPEYLARKRAREIEALERKAKKEYRRRNAGAKPNGTPITTRVPKKLPPHKKLQVRKLPSKVAVRKVGDKKVVMRRNTKFVKRKDSAASSSAGDTTPRVKRKYTKRAPSTKADGTPSADKVKGKRGRPRKTDVIANRQNMLQPKIRVRSNLMPDSEPISLDSDDEPDLGSPSQASDSLSLDENLRALRHIHEKYANIDKDDLYEAHLITANFKKPNQGIPAKDDDVLSIRSSEGGASVKELETRVEKLEDSSNSDSDSSSSSSSSSGSSSDSSSGSSSSSDSESDDDIPVAEPPRFDNNDSRSFGAWSADHDDSGSESDPERQSLAPPPTGDDDVSCSDNESSDKSFQCHICSKWFSTRVTLKIHRRSHQNRGGGGGRSRARSADRYECDYCDETFNSSDKLSRHKAEAHRGAMTVKCEVCRRCFEHDSELSDHWRQHTEDEKAGRCTECGARFPRYDQLMRHRTAAHNHQPSNKMPHACTQCGKRFSHLHSLTRHMHNHTKQLFRCVVCKASFAKAEQLAQHLNSHLANYKRLKP